MIEARIRFQHFKHDCTYRLNKSNTDQGNHVIEGSSKLMWDNLHPELAKHNRIRETLKSTKVSYFWITYRLNSEQCSTPDTLKGKRIDIG